jgi:hypothetical protein
LPTINIVTSTTASLFQKNSTHDERTSDRASAALFACLADDLVSEIAGT